MFRSNNELGASFARREPAAGFIGARSAPQAQKFSYPNNQCPAGYQQTGSGSDGPPRGYSAPWGDYVMCKPLPQAAPAPAAPPPNINVQTTVSPTMQTDISPQISPVFSQMQDSPGATQAATTSQVKPGGMTASNGQSTGEIIEFMRAQAEIDRQRRESETAQRESERREELQRQQAAQQEQQQAAAQRQAQLDAEWREAQAAQQAAYEQALQDRPQATPSTFVSQPGQFVAPTPAPLETITIDKGLPQEMGGTNWLLIAGGVLLAGGVYYLSTQKGKRK